MRENRLRWFHYARHIHVDVLVQRMDLTNVRRVKNVMSEEKMYGGETKRYGY